MLTAFKRRFFSSVYALHFSKIINVSAAGLIRQRRLIVLCEPRDLSVLLARVHQSRSRGAVITGQTGDNLSRLISSI